MTKISIRGPIISNEQQWIYDWFEIDAISPAKFAKQLAEVKDGEVELEINSPGGSVYAASDMYTQLRSSGFKTIGKIMGIAASAASFLAMACNKLMISPTAQIMIHNAVSGQQGDYRDMDNASTFLQNVNKSIMNAYHLKSNIPYDDLKEMMDQETYLTAQEAKDFNFVDEILFVNSDTVLNSVQLDNSGLIPDEIINKMMNRSKELKGLSVENSLPIIQTSEIIVTNTQEEEQTPMNLEELKNNHPDLYEEVFNLGVKTENNRIKSIEDLAIPGNESLVTSAKFEKNLSAEQLAVEMIKAQKVQGANFLQNIQEDVKMVNAIASPVDDKTNNLDKTNQLNTDLINAAVKQINSVRGVK